MTAERETYAERYFRERGISLQSDKSAAECCYPTCGAVAEWSIYDHADRAPDAGTDACTAHVGDLLGRRPHLSADEPWEFTVVALPAEQVSAFLVPAAAPPRRSAGGAATPAAGERLPRRPGGDPGGGGAGGAGVSAVSDIDDCTSCAEGAPRGECPQSERPCGHHCNHSWSHDSCCWCGTAFGEDGDLAPEESTP